MRPPLPVALIAVLLIASKGPDAPPSRERELPWLRGFPAEAYTDEPTAAAAARLRGWLDADADADADADEACTTTSRGALALAADVAPAPGTETVLASYTSGVIVLDARGHKLASLPPLTCHGSVDTIESLAAADLGLGAPVIALAATAGGRAERTTWMYLFVVRGERLAPTFAAPVEEWHGAEVATGEIALGPGDALRYRAPDGAASTWAYNRAAGRFVLLRSSPPPPPPPPMAPGPAA